MSLVHQALRKAEQEKQRKTGAVAPVPTMTRPIVATPAPQSVQPTTPVAAVTKSAAAPPRSVSWLLPISLIAIAAVAIVAIVVIVLRTAPPVEESARRSEIPVAAVAYPPAVAVPSEPPTESRPPEPPTVDTSPYKLTGISKDPAGNYLAIINGQLRGVNEYVAGATIKKIERDRVTLDVDGRESVVRLY